MYMDVDVTSDIKILTPEVSQYLRDYCMYDRQRPMRGVTIGSLANVVANRQFRPGSQMCAGIIGDVLNVLDGWHRLFLSCEEKVSLPVTLTVYHCKNMQQLNELYITFDTGIGARTIIDLYAAYYGLDVFDQLPRNKLGQLLSAMIRVIGLFSENILKIATHDVKLRCVMGNKLIREMLKILKILDAGNIDPQRILKAEVLAVALLTLKYKPRLAEAFWREVTCAEGNSNIGSPAHAFRALLDSEANLTARGSDGSRKKKNPRAMSQSAANCWNAHCRGIQLINADSGARGERETVQIDGTPFRHERSTALFVRGLAALGVSTAQFALLKKYGRKAGTRKVRKSKEKKA